MKKTRPCTLQVFHDFPHNDVPNIYKARQLTNLQFKLNKNPI